LSGGGAVDEDEEDEGVTRGDLWNSDGLSEEVESKYLTLSWWLLHVGWKDVGERVRRAVEETFDGCVHLCLTQKKMFIMSAIVCL
jgi:peroxin-3